MNQTLIANLTRSVHRVTVFLHAHLFPVESMHFVHQKIIEVSVNASQTILVIQPQNCAGSNAYGRKKRQADDVEDAQVYTGQLREEIQVQSNAILTIERRTESRIDPQTSSKADEDVCVSKIGFIIALVITALLALVAVAIAVSCWLMAYRRRPKTAGPLPHPAEFPNPLFTTPTPPLTEPAPDYLS